MTGTIGILSVGAGDTRLTFDKDNPVESIRSARIVTDMLRRGYALLIEVDDGQGGKAFQRVTRFREDTAEYIIADFDPVQAAAANLQETQKYGEEQEVAPTTNDAAGSSTSHQSPAPKRRGSPAKAVERAIPAAGTRGVAIARSAGG